MRTLTLLSLLLCFQSGFANPDSSVYQILYQYTFQSDSTGIESTQKITTELLIGNKLSSYHTVKKYQSDSAFIKSTFKTGIAKSFGPLNLTGFEIHKTPELIRTYETLDGSHLTIENELYVYEEGPSVFNWTVLSDTATVHGLACQKAQMDYAGRVWTAWFTPTIPIADGPYKFCGLPGLIVSIHDQSQYFKFDLVSIKKTSKAIFDQETMRPDVILRKTAPKEFARQRRFYSENMVEVALSAGHELPAQAQKTIREGIKKQNNTLEKW